MGDQLCQDTLHALLVRAVPEYIALRGVERLSSGASQATYRIDTSGQDGPRRFALRLGQDPDPDAPQRGIGLTLEARLMQLAAAHGVPAPRVRCILEAGDGLGAGCLMDWLDGETLGARIVRSSELEQVRPRLAAQCGEILARIHAIDLADDPLADALEIIEPRRYVEQVWADYQALETDQPMIDYTARWLLENIPAGGRQTLVHNDFRNGNLMVGPEGIRAVLDWELAHIGDPLRDLGWLCTNSWRFGVPDKPVGGFGQRADLVAAYERASGHTVDPAHLHFWEVFGSFWWAVGCLRMAQSWRDGSDSSVERPAIGRRSSECQADCVSLLIPGAVEPLREAEQEPHRDLPDIAELAMSVRQFLDAQSASWPKGRGRFLARVAGNSLGIVEREARLGAAARAAETKRLQALFGSADSGLALRHRLVEVLRDGSMALETPGLADTLRESVLHRLAIDQPTYALASGPS